MNDFSHHLFREIYGQPELWLSIGSRADEIGAVLEQARAIGPNLVHVTGRGSSAHAASIIGRHAEEVLNVPSRFFSIEDASRRETQPSHSSMLTFPRSIAFVVSQSGQSPDLLAATNELHQHAELVIEITNSDGSPVAASADVHLADVAGESLRLTERIPDQLFEDIEATGRVMIVGPANNLAIAQEAALKLSENAGITAVAMSASDAIHGPIAQVGEEVTVLSLLSTPGAPQALANFDRRVLTMGKRVWHLDSTGFHRGAQKEPRPLDVAPIFAGLLELIPLQWLSGVLAQRSGMDPDSPRALVKETMTQSVKPTSNALKEIST